MTFRQTLAILMITAMVGFISFIGAYWLPHYQLLIEANNHHAIDQHEMLLFAASALAFITLTILLSLLYKRYVLTPNIRLYTAMRNLAKTGDVDTHLPPIDRSQMGQLSLVFAHMREAIAYRDRQLKKRFDEVEELRQIAGKNEERFNLAMRGASVGLWDWDVTNKSLYWSPQFLDILGLPEHFTPSTDSFSRLLHPHDRDETINALKQHIKDGTPYHRTYRMQHHDGYYIWLESKGQALRDASNRATHMAGYVSDITQRKLAQQRFRKLFEQSTDGQALYDAHGIRECNQAAVRLLSYPDSASLEGMALSAISVAEQSSGEAEKMLMAMQRKAVEKGHERAEWQFVRADGSVLDAELTITPITLDNESIFLASWRDITERKEAEDKLLASSQELQMAIANAEAASQAKSEFLANMSHEIRTPMNGVIGMVQLLRDTALSSEQKKYTEIIEDSSQLLLQLLNDILDFSKIEAGKMSLEQIPFDLARLAEEIVLIESMRVRDKPDLDVKLELDPNAQTQLIGDPGRIRQILYNLINNAIKFTDEGHVTLAIDAVETLDNATSFTMAVKDTGIGIAPEHLDKIFNKFDQADTSTTRKFGGTGLGLAICKNLAEMMHGTITVESTQGEGTVFTVTLTIRHNADHTTLPNANLRMLDGTSLLLLCASPTYEEKILGHMSSFGMRTLYARTLNRGFKLLKKGESDLVIYVLDEADFTIENLAQLHRDIDDMPPVLTYSVAPIRGQAQAAQEAGCRGYFSVETPLSMLTEALALAHEHGELPLLTRHSMNEMHALEPANQQRNTTPANNLHILLAEDNVVNQKVAQSLLTKLGCTVSCATNGHEAVEMVQSGSIDMILMDCQMPELDGYEATQQIRQLEEGSAKRIPIIALTAHAMKGDKEKCLEAGMDDYLSKPIYEDQLAEMISRWTSAQEAA